MNIARTICTIRNKNVSKKVFRNFRISSSNYDSTHASQPKVQEEKYDFEDLKVIERVENRKAAIPPFMKNVFVSIFDRELLAYPEILNKDDSADLDKRVSRLQAVFGNPEKTKEERKEVLKQNQMYAAPVALTLGGLAMNVTESIRYLETISSDLQLAQQLSDHWVALEALKAGLRSEQFRQILDDLVAGENTVSLCVKEKLAERISQADFRTIAEMDGQEIWRISGEKVCSATTGYFLVLGSSEAGRIRAFLVHPGAAGVTATGDFVTFQKTPATPLDEVTEVALAQILGASRLHTATLCRCSLQRAMLAAIDYIRDRVFNGKPLSEMPTLRSTIGSTLLDIYASESAEYFTAGLLDGYLNPDAEMEMAMCRNFIASTGLARSLDLLSIPPLENQKEFSRYLEDMRLLTFRGENRDGVNIFIALNGIHHAGKVMAEEIKQIRNPLFHPSFIVKKVFANRHQEKDDPKLNLYLAEHLHPSLRPAAEQLEYSVLRMRFACETIMGRHGNKVGEAFTELNRLAEAATEILVMTAVLARASRSYCIGVRNAELEMKLAACFVEQSRDRVRKLIKELDDGEFINLDHFKLQFGKRVLDTKSVVVEKATTRVFW
ncbi:complex I assembly factor ACAD9, mitochondrial [Cydia pomonella]|uniref:complex I assembly factor ACAD9, mitochondrial n=1 Tax=Cydia pomonella TaxID=82600 RepID=UPI002ADD9AFB|nr:complex I assembly factor ACAD9, mitochondrial [Cydia pomonella]